MNYTEYQKAFSCARLNKYLMACNGDAKSALVLYHNNVKLCQKFYGVLNIFEVVLRNAINEHYRQFLKDDDWIRNQLDYSGVLGNHPQRMAVIKIISDLDKDSRYTNDRVVSSVSLGFWTHLFSRRPFLLGGQSLLQIFPAKTKGLGQRAIYNELQLIKLFRNRIAHHEAICFNACGVKSTTQAKEYYELVIKYIQFLGYSESRLFYGFDVLPNKMFGKIDLL